MPQLESSRMPRLLMVKPPETPETEEVQRFHSINPQAEDKEEGEDRVKFDLTLYVTSATDGFIVPSKT